MSFNAGDVTSELHLDRSPFIRSLQAARREAADFASRTYNATVGADAGEARRDFAGARSAGRAYAGERYEATVDVNDRPGRRTLDGFDDVLRRYSRSWGAQGVRARVTADIRRATRSLQILENELDRTVDPERKVRIEAETLRARQRLEGLKNLARDVGASDPTLSVNIRGAAATAATMFGLQGLADRLDGYNIRMKADVDGSLSKALPSALGALEIQVTQLKTVMTAAAAVAMPLFYTSVAALPGVLSLAGGAAGSLAITLSQAVVGGVTAVTGALGFGVAALGGYGAALLATYRYSLNLTETLYGQYQAIDRAGRSATAAKKALAGAKKGTQEYTAAQRALKIANDQVTQEQEVYKAMLLSIGPEQVKLGNATQRLQLRMIRFSGAIRESASPALVGLINTMLQFSDEAERSSTSFVTAMGAVQKILLRTATTGQNLRSIKTVLSGIAGAGAPAFMLLGNAILFTFNVLGPMVPTFLRVLNYMAQMSTLAREWAATKEGQAAIGRIWADLAGKGLRLWRVAVDLGVGLWGVVQALNASGTGNYLFASIENMSRAFRRNMRVGGEWRTAITGFMTEMRPALEALGDLAGTLWTQFFRLAGALTGVKEQGTQMNVLVGAIRAVEQSIVPIVDFLVHELKVIGPMMPQLIRNMGEWFALFARSQPEMIAFIDTFNRLLTAFNSLPQSQQIAIARTLAWITALKALGGGAILGVVGSIAQLLVFKRALSLATGKNIRLFGGLGGAISRVGAWFTRLGGWIYAVAMPAVVRFGGALARLGGEDIAACRKANTLDRTGASGSHGPSRYSRRRHRHGSILDLA